MYISCDPVIPLLCICLRDVCICSLKERYKNVNGSTIYNATKNWQQPKLPIVEMIINCGIINLCYIEYNNEN